MSFRNKTNNEDWQEMPPPTRVMPPPISSMPPPLSRSRFRTQAEDNYDAGDLKPPAMRMPRIGGNKRPNPHFQDRIDDNQSCKRLCRNRPAERDRVGRNDDDVKTTTHAKTHIIFVIDFSSSMKTRDVTTKNQKISRWDAVFQYTDEFLVDQIQQQSCSEERSVGEAFNECQGSVTVSVVIFNDEAKALMRHMPLTGDGRKIRKALETARKMHVPKGGTGFAAGMGLAKQICSMEGSGRLLTEQEARQQNTVVVFLSDGRPGDLNHPPPFAAALPMQTTFRRCGKTFPAAGQHIDAMKETHGDGFALHLICIQKEGKPWLDYLAKRYGGTLHAPDLDVNDNAGEIQSTNQNDGDFSNNSEEDEILEMKVKSQDTLLRERHARAIAAGQVHSIQNTTVNRSSLRSTFQAISSSVTAMRGGGRLKERQGVVFKEKSAMIAYDATRMVLNSCHDKFVVPSNEKPNGRRVKVSLHPFAQGGLRNVYRMEIIHKRSSTRQVAKESRHDVGYSERLRFHIETSKCQAQAQIYAKRFNKSLRRAKESISIGMLRAEVIRLKDPASKGGWRYLAVESEIEGKYSKWNSNNGYVNPSSCIPCLVAQAFSHFTYEESKQKEIVVDIQGGDYTYTDPQLHSQSKDFGRADRGKSGVKSFFETHKCNFICKALQLEDRTMEF